MTLYIAIIYNNVQYVKCIYFANSCMYIFYTYAGIYLFISSILEVNLQCGCEQSTIQHVHCIYIVYTCIYLYIPCWTLDTDFVRIWMQDTTVGAWVVVLHEQFMGWVPSNINYVHAWYVHAYLGIYQDMHVCTCISWYVPRHACTYMHILVP